MKQFNKEEIFKEEAMVHFNEIFRVAYRMTRKKEEAEELVQDTFMQAWQSFEKYEPGTNCRAWLYQILFNKNSGAKRKRFAQTKYIQDVDEFVFDNAAAHVSNSEHLTNDTVIGALDDLPDYYRSVILLVDVYDFKYKEVTEILQIPIGTVMSRLNRARAELRKTLRGFAVENRIIQPQTENLTQSDYAFRLKME